MARFCGTPLRLLDLYLCAATVIHLFLLADAEYSRYDRQGYSSHSEIYLPHSPKPTCPTCPTCPAPCTADTPTPPPPPVVNTPCPNPTANCSANPCYFPSLPYVCPVDQCEMVQNNPLTGTKTVIFGVPPVVCITTCQINKFDDNGLSGGFILFQFGACTRFDDLSTRTLDGSPNVNGFVSPEVKCTSSNPNNLDCFEVDSPDRVVTRKQPEGNCKPEQITQTTYISCTLILNKLGGPANPLAQANFVIQVIPVSCPEYYV